MCLLLFQKLWKVTCFAFEVFDSVIYCLILWFSTCVSFDSHNYFFPIDLMINFCFFRVVWCYNLIWLTLILAYMQIKTKLISKRRNSLCLCSTSSLMTEKNCASSSDNKSTKLLRNITRINCEKFESCVCVRALVGV